jgi:hypothetical protein
MHKAILREHSEQPLASKSALRRRITADQQSINALSGQFRLLYDDLASSRHSCRRRPSRSILLYLRRDCLGRLAITARCLPDAILASFRSSPRTLSICPLSTLDGRLVCRALVVLIRAKATLLQIPERVRDNNKSSSSAN